MSSGQNIKTLRSSVEPILRMMRGGANAVNPNTPGNVPVGMQIVETFIIVVIFSLSIQLIDSSFTRLQNYQSMAVNLYPLTYNTPLIYIQDPTSCFEIIYPSNNERNGIEYSYSAFINVAQDNFTNGSNSFRHVFHKGSPGIYPLMAPGVFFMADSNTLRVYQNSTLKWDNYVDIPNIPVAKWFHLVVMLKGNALDIYINGNLANRKKLNDIPKLNYGNFYMLNGSTVGDSTSESCNSSASMYTDLSANKISTSFIVVGSMHGYVSRVKYFAYALSYAQIDKLLREGPNTKIYNSTKDPVLNDPNFSLMPSSSKKTVALPFYQTDDWWTSDVHSGLGPQ